MRLMVFPLAAISGLLAACTTTTHVAPMQGDPVARACRPEDAGKLVGRATLDDAQIQQSTGAELIRRIAPGDAVTHDFRENRITLAIDSAGKIVQATCG